MGAIMLYKKRSIDCPQCDGEGAEVIERVTTGYHNFSPYIDYYDAVEDCRLCVGSGQVTYDNAEDRLYYWKIKKGHIHLND